MSYPRNSATPPTIGIGEIRLIADGTLQITGASVRVLTAGGAWGAGAGTLACDATSGLWTYTPTQAETDGEWFIVAAYKSNCTGCQQSVVTSASATSGHAYYDWATDVAHAPTIPSAAPSAEDNAAAVRVEIANELAAIEAVYGFVCQDYDGDGLLTPADAAIFYSAIVAASGAAQESTLSVVAGAVADIPTTVGDATLAKQNDILDAIAALDVGGGTGANTITTTVTDGTDPLEGAKVRYTKGAESYLVQTNASGVAVHHLDNGTWACVVTLPGFTYAGGNLVVTGDRSNAVAMTANTITPPSNPDDCACAWICLDSSDSPVQGVKVRARPHEDATAAGYAWSGQTREATSGADGVAVLNLPQGSKWYVRRDGGVEELYTVPSTSTAVPVSIRGAKLDTH